MPGPDDEFVEKQVYKKDILLHKGLRARLIKKEIFVLADSLSNKNYEFKTSEAGEWVTQINKLIDETVTVTEIKL